MKRIPLLYLVVAPFLVGCVVDQASIGAAGTGGLPGTGAGTGGGGAVSPDGTGGAASNQSGGGTGGGATGSGGVSAGTDGGAPAADAGAPSGGGGPSCATDAMPPVIQSMLTSKCIACHGATPLPGASSFVTLASLKAPSRSDPTKTNAAMMLTRIQSTTAPMPPAGGTLATAAEISALRDWIAASYPGVPCAAGSDGGITGAGGSGVVPPLPDPFGVGSICTSKTLWTRGENAAMNPGMACVNCHRSSGEAPIFAIAGTLYATGHEPDNCNGSNGTSGARVVITGADGTVLTLTPNAAGNFSSQAAVRMPYHAKVTFMGRERLMISTQTNGDCNACHTQTGASLAPGRIVLP